MATVTKKELIDRIADKTQAKRVVVKRILQNFLDEVVEELARGNRLEFRDFGVFETRLRAARRAQNPKTLEQVDVPPKRTVKFKMGRLMRLKLAASTPNVPTPSVGRPSSVAPPPVSPPAAAPSASPSTTPPPTYG